MTLADLSRAWAELRTAAFGRSGLEPRVTPELASDLTYRYERFLEWYGQAGPLDEALGSAAASAYINSYRAMVAAARKQGVRVSDASLPETPVEVVQDVAQGLSSGVKVVLGGIAALGAAFALFKLARARSKR